MVLYPDRRLDGTSVNGDGHEVKLRLVAGWADGHLGPRYVTAREPAERFAQRLSTEAVLPRPSAPPRAHQPPRGLAFVAVDDAPNLFVEWAHADVNDRWLARGASSLNTAQSRSG